ncbi:MAG: hypothetical protein K0R48_1406 [Gammaproteobacteria bacterium]|jgi:hypothetical protein|nr:hypothetical protein [Gammaproteobacteria bacterium]
MNTASYRLAFLGYAILFFAITFHYWGQGQIISPYNPSIEMGLTDHATHSLIENRKFADFQLVYIPEINEQFHSARSGWLALWDKQNELGRPLYHLSGFSPAYPLSWGIAQFTHNPYYFITLLSLLTCFLSGIFIILLCKELELEPLAGLISGIGLATCPLFMYWLTFPMFLGIGCWAAGTLWALTRLQKKMDFLSWNMLSFSLYSLLLTAYPQGVIFHVYLFMAYGAYLLYKKQKLGWVEFGRFCALSLSAVLLALILALPIYLDLYNIRTNSARVSPDLSFFTTTLPALNNFPDIARFFTLSTFPELLGSPLKATYPFPYNGLSITALTIFFSVFCFYSVLRKTWGWWLAVLLFGLFSVVPFLYIFGVKYLGFNFSSCTPLVTLLLPLTLIVAYGIDALVKRSNPQKISRAVLLSTSCLFLAIVLGLIFVHRQGLSLHISVLYTLLIVIIILASQYRKTYPILLLSATILIMAKSYPLMFHQDLKETPKTSAFIEKVRANLASNSRFAMVGPGLSILPPNFNAPLGLPSIHSYNSLSSTRYQHLISELGGEVNTYGRWNSSILPNYSSTPFWMSNISLILSATKLSHKDLSYQGKNSDVYFYKVISRMGESIQLIPRNKKFYTDELQIDDPRTLPQYIPLKQLDQGDKLEFTVHQTGPSIFILSQKFYPDWQAQVFHASKWVPAKTMLINGVFQGVWLPNNTEKVRLEFKSYTARFAWIAPVFWLLFLILLVLKYSHSLYRKKSSPGALIK